ncbi:HD domain-containing protein [Flavobacterium rhizosphaerae]|uniref:Metal-dependent HD superfamily phosphohydrolase n=1 Tax=Flavobacterium rhizosphaerae TaxID=3163298 RepID=A0ABW8YUZ2_9FLAO
MKSTMLKNDFITACSKYSSDTNSFTLWEDITVKYHGKKRYYHTLNHLEHMYSELCACKGAIQDWPAVIFALVYHDIIYKATAKDNEEQSAEYARKVLSKIGYPNDKINLCEEIILATKSHTISRNNSINIFTDADLAILGSSWEKYESYFKNVRKEYAVYPDILYKPGRKKVLQHFLDMENIFKTAFFRDKYETPARNNIKAELNLL